MPVVTIQLSEEVIESIETPIYGLDDNNLSEANDVI